MSWHYKLDNVSNCESAHTVAEADIGDTHQSWLASRVFFCRRLTC